MIDLQTRIRLFMFGCVPVRLALILLAAFVPASLRILAIPAAIIAVGFTVIFAFKLRPTGTETGGKPIWWNALRPIHATFYAAFAYLAWRRSPYAWIVLALDLLLGVSAFAFHHLREKELD